MHLSIVIPTFNRARLLPTTLPALLNQQTAAEVTYEVIFVSNGSTDASEDILEKAATRHPDRIRYFYIQPTGGPSAPRNFGIRKARGDIVIILDDDVVPDPGLVQSYADFHREHPEPHHAALGEVYVSEHLLADPMSLFHMFPYGEVRSLDRLHYLHFWTCNVSVKRRFMLECGMFDESFLYYEDMICGHRLMGHGMHLHFLPTARGQHLHQFELSGLKAKGRMYGLWLYVFVEHLPERAVKERFGILSLDIGAGRLARRLVNRVGLRLVSHPLTMAGLRVLGASRAPRRRLTDFYYRVLFRKHTLAGYYEAKREVRAGRKPLGNL